MFKFLRRLRQGKHRSLQRGQGLVEYSLILVLVAIVVIGIMSILGTSIRGVYCDALTSLDPNLDPPACDGVGGAEEEDNGLSVSCVGVGNGATVSGNISLEGAVTDNSPPDNVSSVVFKIDGATVRTEHVYGYCLGGGDNVPCNPYNTSGLSNGSHTISVLASDADGNTGSCSITINVNN